MEINKQYLNLEISEEKEGRERERGWWKIGQVLSTNLCQEMF